MADEVVNGRTTGLGHERTLRAVVEGNERDLNVLVVEVVEVHLDLEGAGVAWLHVLGESGMGSLAVAVQGQEAGGRSGLVEVEVLGQWG